MHGNMLQDNSFMSPTNTMSTDLSDLESPARKRLVRFKAELVHNDVVVAKQSFKYRRGTLLRTAWRDAIKYFLSSGKLEETLPENSLNQKDSYSVRVIPVLMIDLNKDTGNIDNED